MSFTYPVLSLISASSSAWKTLSDSLTAPPRQSRINDLEDQQQQQQHEKHTHTSSQISGKESQSPNLQAIDSKGHLKDKE
jgi:hypothetical protein